VEEILEILESNSKISPEEIAVMVNKSVEEVREAIKKYEEDNVILGYMSLINWEKTSKESVTALIEVKVTPQREKDLTRLQKGYTDFRKSRLAILCPVVLT